MMKVAAVEFTDAMLSDIYSRHQYMEMIQKYIVQAVDNGVDLLVFPGFTGSIYQLFELGESNLQQAIIKICHEEFIYGITELSRKYGLLICPGSYWERQGEQIFHTSCLLQSGHLLLEQRQLYLAKWESQLGLSRGRDVDLIDAKGWKIAIMLSTDVFYPQVARKLALMGADIVLSPVGFVGEKNTWLQISGVWQKAQLNHFFAIESAFDGLLGGGFDKKESEKYHDILYTENSFDGGIECKRLWGETIIHAPLPMTPKEDGILQRTYGKKDFITSGLDLQKRRHALKEFNALAQLNPQFYTKIPGW